MKPIYFEAQQAFPRALDNYTIADGTQNRLSL